MIKQSQTAFIKKKNTHKDFKLLHSKQCNTNNNQKKKFYLGKKKKKKINKDQTGLITTTKKINICNTYTPALSNSNHWRIASAMISGRFWMSRMIK